MTPCRVFVTSDIAVFTPGRAICIKKSYSQPWQYTEKLAAYPPLSTRVQRIFELSPTSPLRATEHIVTSYSGSLMPSPADSDAVSAPGQFGPMDFPPRRAAFTCVFARPEMSD